MTHLFSNEKQKFEGSNFIDPSSHSPPNTANFFKAEVKLEPSFNATADFHKSHIKRRRRLQNASGIKRYAWLFPAHQLSAKTYVQKERRAFFLLLGIFQE